ncbi:hypothetical protein [Paradevosia shaoguanensis]|uniref:hypothetical protein n=1 Tax=Paradevosia shaoguanensis TaxID=1335043 RepID=UPI0019315ADE|nr:hypothetical protein [Paradevosia shaoguanensis]
MGTLLGAHTVARNHYLLVYFSWKSAGINSETGGVSMSPAPAFPKDHRKEKPPVSATLTAVKHLILLDFRVGKLLLYH